MDISSPNETESPFEPTEPVNKKPKTSWIWTYWEEQTQQFKGEQRQVIVCKVVNNSDQTPCGKIYVKSSGSTGNAITHLRNQHDITKDGNINKVFKSFLLKDYKSSLFNILNCTNINFIF